jgi:Uma2 family endonuclease
MVGEIIHGNLLYAFPRPALRHSRAASVLGVDIGGPFDRGRGGPGGCLILDEPELHIGEDVLVPDLAGWRRERMPAIEGVFATVAPDWICEVLSPSTEAIDRGEKLPVYARERVGHVWLVNPGSRTLEILRLDGPLYTAVATYYDDAVVRAAPFDAIELELAPLWRS